MANVSDSWFRRRRPAAPLLLFGVFSVLIAALAVTNVVLYTHLRVSVDANGPIGAVYRMFDLGNEANFPTWVAISLWLCAAAAAGSYSLIARDTWSWRLLALACLVLSADEAAQLHEQLNAIGAIPGLEGFEHILVYPWLLPGAFLALLVAAAFLRTVLALPHLQRGLILLAGVLFLTGALGVEMLGGWALQNSGLGMRYVVLTAAEEAIEMTAVALFACTLMSLMTVRRSKGEFTIRGAAMAPNPSNHARLLSGDRASVA